MSDRPQQQGETQDPWAQYADLGYDEAAVQEDEQRVAAVGSGEFIRLHSGENVLRFLPAMEPGKSPFRVTALHYIKIADKTIGFNCPKVELHEHCPACAKAAELGRSGNPTDREASKKMLPKLSVMANVIDRERPEAGVQIYSFGYGVHEDLKTIKRSARAGGDFTRVGPDGFDIVINKEGSGMQTTYTVQADRNCSPLAETPEEVGDILASMHVLESKVDTMVPEALLAAWGQVAAASRARRRRLRSACVNPPPQNLVCVCVRARARRLACTLWNAARGA